MRINNNMSAIITNNKLLSTENSLAASMERLSSGLRINHAGDDPAGMAISGKMKAQIAGLDQAKRNASDGTSVIQTADGALNEVTQMLQRMRTLAVQAANGTNSLAEREAIQGEIDSLKDEVDRISQSTEFNTKTLLDGSQNAQIYGENFTRAESSEFVPAGHYKFTVEKQAEPAKIDGNGIAGWTEPITEVLAGTITINNNAAEISVGMSRVQVYEVIRNAAELGDCELSGYTDKTGAINSEFSIKTSKVGTDASILMSTTNDDLAAMIFGAGFVEDTVTGKNAVIDMEVSDESQFTSSTTYVQDNNKLTFTDVGGFEIVLKLDANYEKDAVDEDGNPILDKDGNPIDGKIDMNITDIGIMNLQIGANEGQTMEVRIPNTDCNHLYIDDLDVRKTNGPEHAIESLDYAIAKISTVRSHLGAYENRLEHTTNSLGETNENMTSALSRIEDVDMATEMVEYTKQNVLEQAGVSALSQANELPQLALQLLQ